MIRFVITTLALAGALHQSLPAQRVAAPTDSTRLTVDRIYGRGEFASASFGPVRWLDGGAGYTTLERAEGGRGRDIVRYDTETGRREVLVPAARLVPPGDSAPLDIEGYEWSPDGTKLLIFTNSEEVWRTNTRGDYWVLDRTTGKPSKLGGSAPASTMMFAKFSPDGGRVGYVRYGEYNIYVEDLATGRTTAITTDGSRTTINGTFDWVYEEELDLRDGWRWSPDGGWIAYWQLDATGVRDFLLIDDTDSLYSQPVPVQYPKAGETNSAGRVGVVSASGGTTRWMQIPGDPRQNYIARMEWAPPVTADRPRAARDGRRGRGNGQRATGSGQRATGNGQRSGTGTPEVPELVMQHLNRLQNTLHLIFADPSTGAVRPAFTEKDSAWVELVDPMVFTNGGRDIVWESERSGWNHLYLVSRDGEAVRPLTTGAFDVSFRGVDTAAGFAYYSASPDNPTQSYLYRVSLDGRGRPERLSPADAGMHQYNIAPNWRYAVHSYSNAATPPTTDLVRLPDHRPLRTLVDNATLKRKVAGLGLRPPEFMQLDAGDGVKLNAWMIKPKDFDASKRYPVLFFVYGGPGSQTVVDAWQGSQYLWHQMLAQRGGGYIVASVDNRGTGSRGRAWRKIIYGRLGVIETRDQAAAARAVARLPFVDASRIGIWGWSYGGFMALNAITQHPDVYKTAIAVAPVTHWKFYDTIYTERYNGLPQDNPQGYDAGSPLTYAERLRGNLLIVHGSGDDNVHYQNTEAMVNALVEAGRPFDLMVYPNRDHSIASDGATPHLRALLARYVEERL